MLLFLEAAGRPALQLAIGASRQVVGYSALPVCVSSNMRSKPATIPNGAGLLFSAIPSSSFDAGAAFPHRCWALYINNRLSRNCQLGRVQTSLSNSDRLRFGSVLIVDCSQMQNHATVLCSLGSGGSLAEGEGIPQSSAFPCPSAMPGSGWQGHCLCLRLLTRQAQHTISLKHPNPSHV